MRLFKNPLLLVFLLYASAAVAQPMISIPITITDNAGGNTVLNFGLDPAAADSIDQTLGEIPLPPLPPSGIFDARFNIPGGESTLRDYRCGDYRFAGQMVYELQYQTGTGTTISVLYDLPWGVTGILRDKITGSVINRNISGSGSYTVRNPLLYNKLLLIVNYPGISTSVNQPATVPVKYDLYQNYPNPFNPATKIRFSLPEFSRVIVSIYNQLGQRVAKLADSDFSAGEYELAWNAETFSSGIYFCELRTDRGLLTKKMSLLK